jgi:hypothetical protein
MANQWKLILLTSLALSSASFRMSAQSPAAEQVLIDENVSAVSARGEAPRRVKVRAVVKNVNTDGRAATSAVLISVSDSTRRRFWWAASSVTRGTDPAAAVADFFKRAVIYADSTDLYIFNPLRFNVRIGVGVDGFSDEAALPEAVRSRAEQNLRAGISNDSRFERTIDLLPALGIDFFRNPDQAALTRNPTTRSIERFDDRWELILVSYRGREALVTLSPSMELSNAERIK